MAIPSECGRLIEIDGAERKEAVLDIDFKNVLLTGFLYNRKVIGILETDSYENRLACGVVEADGASYGALSVQVVHRLKEYELAEYGHRVPAASPEYFLKVQDSCKIIITMSGDYDGDGAIDWVDGAKILREKLNASVNPYYSGKVVAKLDVDMGTGKDLIPFREALEMIKTYAFLMDGQPLVLYLVGWQHGGHDSWYPAMDWINERLGSFEDLQYLIEEARKYNVTVSFHDNYDDAYMNSPDWDPDVISRDARGDFMKCGYFAGGQAYLISNYKYACKNGLDRVRKTVEKYGIPGSYHADVLSGAYKNGRRYDFNPESPASAKQNLLGKLMIVDKFAQYGVDLTTEDFSCLFIGRISHFWHLEDRGAVYFLNEEKIPLAPFIYHSMASYGWGGFSGEKVMMALLYGACFSGDIDRHNLADCIGMYYLVTLPWIKLYGKTMSACRKDGAWRVTYQDGSYVEADFEAGTYLVVVDGTVIARNFTTFVSMKPGVYLAYSRHGGEFAFPLPPELRRECNLCVNRLKADLTMEKTEYSINHDEIRFFAMAGEPYRVSVEA